MAKRLVFSNRTPNDQDGIIPNEVIDFERYNKNPVLLQEHMWGANPLGILTDIRLINGKFSAIPVFHLETKESRQAAGMYEKGALRGASIGGGAVWKKNPVTDEYLRDANGYKICEKFFLYEVSLVSLPSNPDAVAEETDLHSMIYDSMEDLDTKYVAMTQLSSKFKHNTMPENATTTAPGSAATTTAEPAKPVVTTAVAGAEPATLGATALPEDLPGFIKQIVKQGGSVTFGAVPAPKDEPTSSTGTKVIGDPQPEPIGMAAQAKMKAASKLVKATARLDEAVATFKKKKEDSEDEPGDEKKKEEMSAAKIAMDNAHKAYLSADEEYEKACEAADEEEKEKKGATPAARATLAAHGASVPAAATAPVMKNRSEIENTLKLAAAPSFKAKVGEASQGVTFTRLNASKADKNDQRIIERLFNKDKGDKVDLSVHAIVLNSIINDKRLSAVVERTRSIPWVTDEQRIHMMSHPEVDDRKRKMTGNSLIQLQSELNSGKVQYRDRLSGSLKEMTFLNSTDNALAAPALTTIEWLSLAIFQLFPTTSWKANIPMFGAQMAGANTGFIWANILANPAIYKGTNPSPAADYVTNDGAVSLALTPYWLQPMIWNPLLMHQFRYDQQATGWAQAFAEMNAVIDDNLLYTLASTVPAAAITGTTGLSGYQTNPNTFTLTAGQQGPNSFYWNNQFNGTLLNPVLNDILTIEQIYRNQNFNLEAEKSVLVLDPIGERYLSQDPETKSLLTRFITQNSEEFLGYKHTMFDVRSRVAMYDLATKQVKDFNGAMPATAVSAMLSFMPSQIGMGIGMLDVFMVQDPANYGYRMSADLRIGIAPLRLNFYGTGLYVFNQPSV